MRDEEFQSWLEAHRNLHEHRHWATKFDPATPAGQTLRTAWLERLQEAGATPELALWASGKMIGHAEKPSYPVDQLPLILKLIREEKERLWRQAENDRQRFIQDGRRKLDDFAERHRPALEAMTAEERAALWAEMCEEEPELRRLESLPTDRTRQIMIDRACLLRLCRMDGVGVE